MRGIFDMGVDTENRIEFLKWKGPYIVDWKQEDTFSGKESRRRRRNCFLLSHFKLVALTILNKISFKVVFSFSICRLFIG